MAAPVKPVQSKAMAAHVLGQVTRGRGVTVHPPAGRGEGNVLWWVSQAQGRWLMGLQLSTQSFWKESATGCFESKLTVSLFLGS